MGLADRDRLSGKITAAERVGAVCLSEGDFLRRLGLLPPLARETLTITLDELAKVAGLERKILSLFVLLEVFEGEDGCFVPWYRAHRRAAAW